MKKHKSHARHVFNYLEKNYNINFVFAEDDEKKGSKKSQSGKDKKSVGNNKQRNSDQVPTVGSS